MWTGVTERESAMLKEVFRLLRSNRSKLAEDVTAYELLTQTAASNANEKHSKRSYPTITYVTVNTGTELNRSIVSFLIKLHSSTSQTREALGSEDRADRRTVDGRREK